MVKQCQCRLDELEKYRKSIAAYQVRRWGLVNAKAGPMTQIRLQGDDTPTLLRATIHYFRDLCVDDTRDAPRSASIREALPRIEATLARLERELSRTDEQLQKIRAEVDDARDATLAEFEESLSRTENQSVSCVMASPLVR